MFLLRVIMLFFLLPAFNNGYAMERKQTNAERLAIMADSLFYSEQYPRALEYYIRGLETAAIEGNDRVYLNCIGYISNIYDAFGDYKSAVSYLLKGYKMAVKNKLNNFQANFLINLTMGYSRMGDVENAKKYYNQQKVTPISNNKNYWLYYNLYNKGNILKAEKKFDEAIKAYKEALDFAKNNDFIGGRNRKIIFQLYQESEIGNIYASIGNGDEARNYGYKCVEMAKQVESSELLANAYKMLADGYKIANETDSADKYMSLYASIADSVYNTEEFYSQQSKLTEYEESIRRSHIRHLWYAIAVVLAILLTVGTLLFLLWRNYRHLHEAQRLLLAKNEELEKQDDENKRLLKRYLQQIEQKEIEDNAEKQRNDKTQSKKTTKEKGNEKYGMSQVQKDRLLKQIIDVMSSTDNISNPNFNLNLLADMTNSNTKYVSMVINDNYDKNFKTLLNEYRCREAAKQLTDKKRLRYQTMQAVYESVGYTNATSFIRAFKTVYGVTPSTYMKLKP